MSFARCIHCMFTMLCDDSFMIDLPLSFCFALSSCCFVSAETIFILYLLAFYDLEYHYYNCLRFLCRSIDVRESFYFEFRLSLTPSNILISILLWHVSSWMFPYTFLLDLGKYAASMIY